ncbi:hypothetical protein FQ330_10730 [Agrococcus sediminis]|uniref:Uncharacterized protein n=1 Tax=Agrococcus sediminis TaxID=2599924 RepID=A0A5M8Q7X6_9MICO|nr:hypothetical protein [Agrococcus sediminis]KAA6431238.1 hypothetical protein FQ330_10730 [Agrococcus sediminis]RWR23301.1 hypothetical protein D8Y24_07230 [Agrococcus lahaulensis]
MTDANEGQPLTRRQLRELERAAEAARNGGTPPVPAEGAQAQVSEAPVREGRHSTPSVPAAPEEAREAEQPALQEPPQKPQGRFFGRRKPQGAEAPTQAVPVEQAPIELPETVAMDRVEPAEAAEADVIEAELHAPEASGASVPAPSAARRSSVQVDDVQGLDTVDDDEVDSLEIDEVIVEQPRVSSRRVAESTPAELEDRRRAAEAAGAEEALPTGPTRGQAMRLPVIVNVVSDTSEHHIADLREQGVAGEGGGSSTSSITANALVLPAGSDSPEFQLEGDDGLLVTGSIDVPEGFASSGRGSASIDGSDVDGDVADGEVQSPETAPVRASKAVSSYANARVQIAPQKQRSNVWPVAIGVGAGAFVVGVGAFLTVALTQGWL